LLKQTNNIVANKICVVSKIGLGTGIFGKMAVKGLRHLPNYSAGLPTYSPGTHTGFIYITVLYTTQSLPSVLWHCWLGHLTRKNLTPIWPIMCLVGR